MGESLWGRVRLHHGREEIHVHFMGESLWGRVRLHKIEGSNVNREDTH